MVRLQKQISRRVGDKEYAKYVVVLPPKMVREAGLKAGDEVEVELKGKKVVVKKL